MIKKLTYFAAFIVVAIVFLSSCSSTKTYAELKEEEKASIEAFIADKNIQVIGEDEFRNQNCTTDTTKNQYVLFESSGVYLQIIRKGGTNGQEQNDHFSPLLRGQSTELLARFTEYNLSDASTIQLSNDNQYYASTPEKMIVSNSGGTFSGYFDTSSSLMYTAYSSQAVPSGWLYPLTYLNLGRPIEENDQISKIKIIVPSAQGQYEASSSVYACFYILTFEEGR